MADKSAAEKMRIKPEAHVALLHAPPGAASLLGTPGLTQVDSPAEADVVLLFVTTQADVEQRLARVGRELPPSAALWIIYPKGSKAAGLDVSRDTIWPVAESLGMRPVSMVSVSDVWSGFRLKPAE